MMTNIAFGLMFFLMASTADVVVVTLPARDNVKLPLTPNGEAELRIEGTVTRVKIDVQRVQPPSAIGPAYMTYVVWAVSPEGILENLGELNLDRDRGRLENRSRFEQLGILISAEPHYMVERPSEAIVFQGAAPSDMRIRRITVPVEVGGTDYSGIQLRPQGGVPSFVSQARVAYLIATEAGAQRWAEAELRLAKVALDTMEEMLSRSSPLEILSQSANESIRRAQLAVTIGRANEARTSLKNAQDRIEVLDRDKGRLETSVQEITQQRDVARSEIQQLENDLNLARRETERVALDRDGAFVRTRNLEREIEDIKRQQEELKRRLSVQVHEGFYDTRAKALTPAAREALSRVCGMAEILPGPVRVEVVSEEETVDDPTIESVRAFLIECGVTPDRIVLDRL